MTLMLASVASRRRRRRFGAARHHRSEGSANGALGRLMHGRSGHRFAWSATQAVRRPPAARLTTWALSTPSRMARPSRLRQNWLIADAAGRLRARSGAAGQDHQAFGCFRRLRARFGLLQLMANNVLPAHARYRQKGAGRLLNHMTSPRSMVSSAIAGE